MSVNGITGISPVDVYTPSQSSSKQSKDATKATGNTSTTGETSSSGASDASAVYEPSKKDWLEQLGIYERPGKDDKTTTTQADEATKGTQRTKEQENTISKLKADADAHTERLRSIVNELIVKQANAYGNATDIWQLLASGEFTVDDATKAQAQADIAEDGYYGVEQTADRILDFAIALSGDDKSKANELKEAFEEGYRQAEKTWGGELPEICQQTYDAVMKKFDDWAAS